jgi:hypothetical protein
MVNFLDDYEERNQREDITTISSNVNAIKRYNKKRYYLEARANKDGL